MPAACAIDGCEKAARNRGWCSMHYERWRKHGDPKVVLQPRYAHKGDRLAARRAARTKWRLANPAKMAAARAKWERENPEIRRRYRRERKKMDPLSNRAYVRARRARIKALTVLPFTAEQLRQRMAYFGHRCWMCGAPADVIDHVKPLSKGGAHALCNLRPACGPCNTAKGARWPYPREADDADL